MRRGKKRGKTLKIVSDNRREDNEEEKQEEEEKKEPHNDVSCYGKGSAPNNIKSALRLTFPRHNISQAGDSGLSSTCLYTN